MTDGPSVSIVIPSFRVAATIGAALQSAAQQTIRHEIVVVDGSLDEETAVAISATGIQPDVWIREPDRGVYDAINKGIARATGEWIYILGADDVLADPRALEDAIAASAPEVELIFGDIENLGRRHSRVPPRHRSSLGRGMWIRNTVHQQSALYRRTLFENESFNPDYKVLADYDFHLGLQARGIQFSYVPLIIARCAASGLSKKFDVALYREEYAIKKSRHVPFAGLVWLKYIYKKITW